MKTNFPKQKISSKKKGQKWRQEHLDWVSDVILKKDSPIRTSLKNKIANYNLYLGKTRKEDFDLLLNPSDLDDIFMPDEIQHYPIARPYLNVLIGEEADRRFEWRAIVTNPNAISQIESQKNDMLKQKISALMQDPNLDQDKAEQQLKNFLYYLKFEYQDVREKRANLLLKHFIKELDLKLKFNEGFKNVMICGEEAYMASIVNGNPTIELLDPKKTYILKSGYSNRFEDADVIITYDYIPPGTAVDQYYQYLKNTQIDWLDKETNKRHTTSEDTLENDEMGVHFARQEMFEDYLKMPGEIHGDTYTNEHSEIIDEYGNVRRIRLLWKSYKMIKRIKYFDEFGDVQYRIASEFEKANKTLGEEEEQYWISEWWEGVKLGEDIYPYIRPREIQYNKISDPGYNHPGIVGQIYNTGEMKVVAPMDIAKPYQYLYDAAMHRLNDAFAKYFGSLPVVDKAWIPEGYDIGKWLYFARKAGIAIKDSFKEGNKGMASGKLAGSVGATSNVITQQMGDYIQQQINILNYVEAQLGRIIGVPPQRLGEIQNRETVGGVERAVTQSSFITNEMYKIHDNVKKRVLTLLLETSKIAMKNNPKKFQNIGDDYTAQIFDIDDEFTEEEFGIVIDNENDLTKLEQSFEQLAHAAMQNQALKFSDLMKIFTSSSLSEKQRVIEQGEEEMIQRQERAQERELEMRQQELEAKRLELERKDQLEMTKHRESLVMDKYKTDQDNLTKRIIAEQSKDGVNIEDSTTKLELEYDKLEKEMMLKMKELDEKIRSNKANENLKRQEIKKKPANSSK